MLEMTSAIKSDRTSENVKAQSEKIAGRYAPRTSPVRVDRVRSRMNELGVGSIEVARRAGLARTYVSDLLEGKKEKIRVSAIDKLAEALECSAPYLRGERDRISSGATQDGEAFAQVHGFQTQASDRQLVVLGEIEFGTYRLPKPIEQRVDLSPDQDFIGSRQGAFVVVGDGLRTEFMPSGTVVGCVNVQDAIALNGFDLREEHIVLVSTENRRHPGREFSLWTVVQDGEDLTLAPLGHAGDDREVRFGAETTLETGDYRLSILFVVTRTARLFK